MPSAERERARSITMEPALSLNEKERRLALCQTLILERRPLVDAGRNQNDAPEHLAGARHHRVEQGREAFCSALPVAYTRVPPSYWEVFASLVLQAAYEATMLAAVLNARRGASNVV